MSGNISITQILLKRGNTSSAGSYVGPVGEVIIDTGLNTLRIQDGVTPGGSPMVSATVLTSINANVSAANAKIANIESSIGSISSIDISLLANAVSQQSQIDNLQSQIDNIDFSGNLSNLTNDVGYITAEDIPTNISSFTNDSGYITAEDIPTIPVVPTNISSFTNDSGYITAEDVPSVPTNVSSFTNDSGYITTANIPTNVSSFTNDSGYITAEDIPTIPVVPTNISSFTNDAGYTVYSNANIAAYLSGPAAQSGNVSAGNITIINNISASNFTYANGDAYPGTYTNSNVAEYLSNFDGAIHFAASPAIISGVGSLTTLSATVNGSLTFGDESIQTTAYPGPQDLSSYATTSNVTSAISTAINNLIGSAPGTLDTLQEIAANLANSGSVVAGITSSITGINSNLTAANSAISSLRTDVDSLANVATSGSYNDLINKPTIPVNLGDLTNDIDAITLSSIGQFGYITAGDIPTNVSAFTNDVGYALSTDVSAANTAITTANTQMKSYVDAVTTAWTANASSQDSAISQLRANITAANSAISTNSGTIGALQSNFDSVTADVGTLQANIGSFYTWANTNFGTSSVDTGNITFSDTTISTDSGAGTGIILNSAGSGEIAIMDYTGINNTNPGHWLHIGDGSIGATNNTGNISIDFNNGVDTARGSAIIDWAWFDSASRGNNNRGTGPHTHFGIYKNDSTYNTRYIEFDYSTGNATVGNVTGTTGTFTGNITAGNVSSSKFTGNVTGTTGTFTGNVSGANFVGDGQYLTNVTYNNAGNIIGTGSSVSLVAGSYTATFDNTGVLTLPTNGGDEGGELRLGIPTTNTSLVDSVKIDVYRNQLRFFDGSAKGAYIDLSQAAAGVGTLLNNRVSGYVNAGTYITMDNLKATVTTSGNRGLSLALVSGTATAYVGGVFSGPTVGCSGTAGSVSLSTTATSSLFGWSFPSQGDTSTYTVNDITNSRAYRITLQIGGSYNNNLISIERLI